ncbi:class I SAM-dependent methyltransferase [Candidatus Sumerlaeota bacterium]|nr:class I SAM-dependent methyltransferase [Candidatus Sumerlaeota bacterium]
MSPDSNSLFDFSAKAVGYDRWYETPEGRAHDLAQKADVVKMIGSSGNGRRLLDVGCGTGHWSRFFSSLGFNVYGIDVSPEMLSVAKSSSPSSITFLHGEAGNLPFDNETFDMAASMATLEFISDASLALREMSRCVKRGGTILIGTLNRLSQLNRQRIANGKEPYASGRLFSPDELRKLLSPFGNVRMLFSDSRSKEENSPGETDGYDSAPFIIAEVQK